MHRRSRPLVPRFQDGERVFFRWYRNDVEPTFNNIENPTGITPNKIETPDQSVNRSGLQGRYWFVLMPERNEPKDRRRKKLCMGVLTIPADRIPTPINHDGASYSFRIEHDPLDHNYQHCEIRVYKDGVCQTATDRKELKKLLPKVVKIHYREKMAEAASWMLRPEIGHN